MKKWLLIILVVLVGGMIYLFGRVDVLEERKINNLNQKEIGEITQEKVEYIINKGNGKIISFQIVPSENSTVFSLLEELAERENFKVESKIYEGMGVFVESINGVKNGTDNKYWQYWVNDELPMVAADKKEVRKGDKVEWKFAPSPF